MDLINIRNMGMREILSSFKHKPFLKLIKNPFKLVFKKKLKYNVLKLIKHLPAE